MKQVMNILKDIEYKKRVIKLSKIYEDNNNEFLWKVLNSMKQLEVSHIQYLLK